MPIDRERQRLVREGLEQLRQLEGNTPFIEDSGVECENLAETLAVIVAIAREAGEDESIWTEVAVKFIKPEREKLIEARRVLGMLGYTRVTPVLARMAKSAPRVPAWLVARKGQRRTARGDPLGASGMEGKKGFVIRPASGLQNL